jgi:hypothetical protein
LDESPLHRSNHQSFTIIIIALLPPVSCVPKHLPPVTRFVIIMNALRQLPISVRWPVR